MSIELLVWATVIPLMIVLLFRSSKQDSDCDAPENDADKEHGSSRKPGRRP